MALNQDKSQSHQNICLKIRIKQHFIYISWLFTTVTCHNKTFFDLRVSGSLPKERWRRKKRDKHAEIKWGQCVYCVVRGYVMRNITSRMDQDHEKD